MRTGRVHWNDRMCVCPRCLLARSFFERLRGLLGRKKLSSDEAMLIDRCGSIHTIGMAFPIDLFFVDRAFSVCRVVRGVRPGKMMVTGGFHARRVYETPTDAWPREIRIGDSLRLIENKEE